MKFSDLFHRLTRRHPPSTITASRVGFDPPASTLKLAPPVADFFNEDAVLDYISSRGFFVDSETGEIEPDAPGDKALHWSLHWQFRPLSRKVRVRTTTRWPDPRDFQVMEFDHTDDDNRIEWGITGAQRLRLYGNPQFRKWLLDHIDTIGTDRLLAVVIARFNSLEMREQDGVYSLATRGVDPRAVFWNPEGFAPLVEILRDGYFDFPLLTFETEGEASHGS